MGRTPRSEFGFQWRLMMESETKKRTSHKNEFVKATNANGEVKFFKNGMEASRELGCSHTLVYKALNN